MFKQLISIVINVCHQKVSPNTQSRTTRFSVKTSTQTQSSLCLKPFTSEEYCAMTYIISAYYSPSFAGIMLALFCNAIAIEFAGALQKLESVQVHLVNMFVWFMTAVRQLLVDH